MKKNTSIRKTKTRRRKEPKDLEHALVGLLARLLTASNMDDVRDVVDTAFSLPAIESLGEKHQQKMFTIIEGSALGMIYLYAISDKTFNHILTTTNTEFSTIIKNQENLKPNIISKSIPASYIERFNYIRSYYELLKDRNDNIFDVYKVFQDFAKVEYGYVYRFAKNNEINSLETFLNTKLSKEPLSHLKKHLLLNLNLFISGTMDQTIKFDLAEDTLLNLDDLESAVLDIDYFTTVDQGITKKTIYQEANKIFKVFSGLSLNELPETYSVYDLLLAMQKQENFKFTENPFDFLSNVPSLDYPSKPHVEISKEMLKQPTDNPYIIYYIEERFYKSLGYRLPLLASETPFTIDIWYAALHKSLIQSSDLDSLVASLIPNLYAALFVEVHRTTKPRAISYSNGVVSAHTQEKELNLSKEITSLKKANEALKLQLTSKDTEIYTLTQNSKAKDAKFLELERDYANTTAKLETKISKLESETFLLPSLLNSLYENATEVVETKEVDIVEQAQTLLEGKKVVMVGGHQNFLAKVHQLFPQIFTIESRAFYGETQVQNADVIIYVATYLNHSQFMRLSPYFKRCQNIIFANNVTSMKRLSSLIVSNMLESLDVE